MAPIQNGHDARQEKAMTSDYLTPHDRLCHPRECLWGLALIAVGIILFLLTDNAAPQAGQDNIAAPSQEGHAAGPAVAAPILGHPVCPGHFWITQRVDKRNRKGEIVKATWKYACLSDRR